MLIHVYNNLITLCIESISVKNYYYILYNMAFVAIDKQFE